MNNKALVVIDLQNDITKNYKEIIETKHGAAHCRYDDVGQCNRRGAVPKKRDFHRVWRNPIMGISVLCTRTSDHMECSD